MRWCVSVGAVLVAGAIVGGDVASIAAPSPKSGISRRQAQRTVRQCRARYRRRRLLFDGSGRTRHSARGLCTGHRLERLSSGAKGPSGQQGGSDLFRVVDVGRRQDHHSVARDPRPGIGGRRGRRDHENADSPEVRAPRFPARSISQCSCSKKIPIAGRGASSTFPAMGRTTTEPPSPARATLPLRKASSSTACRSW